MPDVRPQNRQPPVLVVTSDQVLLATVTSALSPDLVVEPVGDHDTAERAITGESLHAAILDMQDLGRRALSLARTFLRCQPSGRVLLVAAASGPQTLVGMSLRDPRIDCLFRPVDAAGLRDALMPSPSYGRGAERNIAAASIVASAKSTQPESHPGGR